MARYAEGIGVERLDGVSLLGGGKGGATRSVIVCNRQTPN